MIIFRDLPPEPDSSVRDGLDDLDCTLRNCPFPGVCWKARFSVILGLRPRQAPDDQQTSNDIGGVKSARDPGRDPNRNGVQGKRLRSIRTELNIDQHRCATHQWLLPVHCGDQEQRSLFRDGDEEPGTKQLDHRKPTEGVLPVQSRAPFGQ
ncbi:hypothetical protein BO70DRAFT_101670 [Aspergillus heteromorphus CBS 117.55]|uniref:Uncharacterized protein n=1 Tax=Aspergillus heteromorphus CBS 117.55 TaxID=1448321 RepID=A0A317VNF5_9EURO|nr:uncharacterized protein BO70DRAFT_101670 [Aspergillus heteromorphus CBS 117.55]PWY75119.1 hypothetical protein BO70DRAFT_101670 [Aspergillus heteromorphus CBS 117.55]